VVPRCEQCLHDALLPPVVADLARERGVDSIWIAPLNAEERADIASVWPGGSVRQLRRLSRSSCGIAMPTQPKTDEQVISNNTSMLRYSLPRPALKALPGPASHEAAIAKEDALSIAESV
jgi:hypothetical protein